ncbi:cell division protein PerM [Nesterenkonia suensis]
MSRSENDSRAGDARDAGDARNAGDAGEAVAPRRPRLRLPAPPLWLLGLLEAVQVLLATALLVALPVLAVGLAGGFAEIDLEFMAAFSAQIWLVLHGTPVEVAVPVAGDVLGGGVTLAEGWLHLLPMGFTLVPLALGWRAGGRLARGAYSDQLWQGLLTLVLGYAAAAVGIAHLAEADGFAVQLHWAALCAAGVMAVGALAGSYAEARSWTRLIGIDLEDRVERLSQRLKWAGHYAWAVIRGGLLAVVVAVGLSALLLAVQLGLTWMEIANTYQRLDPGVWGVVGLTLLHLGLLPNLVLWTLSYTTGAGFALGSGSTVAPHAVELGPVPALPVLGALPSSGGDAMLAVLALPLIAGMLAGWWLMREGENHLDDWCALRISWRPVSWTLSTLALGVLTGAVAAVVAVLPLWLSHISLGIGRLTDVGPHALLAAGLLGVWVGVGTILGYLIAPAAHTVRRRRVQGAETLED